MRPTKTSKAFWEAMSKVQNHLTDAKKIAAYNQKKEQKMRVGGRGCCWLGGWVAEGLTALLLAALASARTLAFQPANAPPRWHGG